MKTWPTKKLEEITEKLKVERAPVGSWPYIEIGDIDIGNKSIIFKDKKSIKGAVVAPKDSVLVSRVRPTRGAITLLDKDYPVSSAFTILRAKSSETSSKFLFYCLAHSRDFLDYLQKKQRGSNYPSVREKDVLNFKISLLPPLVQQKIVERLDAIKKAQELNDKQIALAEELFQSLLHRELNPKGKNWKMKKLNELLLLCNSGTWGSSPEASNEGVFVLRSTNFTASGELDFKDVAKRKIDVKKIDNLKLEDGDILLEKSGGGPDQPVGRVAYFINPNKQFFAFANFIQRLRSNSRMVNGQFLFYYFLKLYRVGFTNKLQSQTTGIRNLKLNLYLRTEIPLPSIETQRKIVEKLQAVQDYKKKLLEQKQKLQELFESVLNKSFKD